MNTAKIKIRAMKIISDRNKLPIAQASDIDRAAPEGKGAKWAQTNLHQNPDLYKRVLSSFVFVSTATHFAEKFFAEEC